MLVRERRGNMRGCLAEGTGLQLGKRFKPFLGLGGQIVIGMLLGDERIEPAGIGDVLLLGGAIRRGADDNITAAVEIMREELREFLTGTKYADERSLAQTGGDQLAFASLAAESDLDAA